MGCFEFLRRNKDKKANRRKAVSARAECNKSSTKRALTGGVAFSVVLDNRPLTPFRGLTPRTGHKHMSFEEKRQAFEKTLARREDKLGERTNFARQSAIRRADVLQKREASNVLVVLKEVDDAGDVTPREEGHSVPSSSA